ERGPNPDVGGAKNGCRMLVVDSDTDVEEAEVLPDVGCPKIRRTAPNTPKTPGVEMETPNPDVGGPKNGRWALVDSDTDVETENSNSAVEGPKDEHRTLVPDVAVTAPNPDVSPPASPGDGSDTDMEEVAPTPDVRSLRSRIWTRNQPHPDVGGPTTGSDAVVEEPDPKRRKPPPKGQSWSPKSPGDARVGGMVPKGGDSAPGTAVEAPNPDVGARQRAGETPARDEDPTEPPDVLFTGVVASPGMEVALKTLGGSMATSVFDCTHLVTDRVRRTVKFLCAVARGVPVVTPEWLHESARSGRVLVPGPFLVRDSQQERHFGFSLAEALRRARRHPLLQGYEVHVTPNVRPEPEHMRDIVTCSGGTFLPTMPRTYGVRGQRGG
ncbi:Mediator of DNA damage checkpoint protein 1, partial [Eudyptes sclateri]